MGSSESKPCCDGDNGSSSPKTPGELSARHRFVSSFPAPYKVDPSPLYESVYDFGQKAVVFNARDADNNKVVVKAMWCSVESDDELTPLFIRELLITRLLDQYHRRCRCRKSSSSGSSGSSCGPPRPLTMPLIDAFWWPDLHHHVVSAASSKAGAARSSKDSSTSTASGETGSKPVSNFFLAFVMPFASVGTLSELLHKMSRSSRDAPPEIDFVSALFLPAVMACSQILNSGGSGDDSGVGCHLVSRDMKSDNLFVFDSPNWDSANDAPLVVLGDFGLSRCLAPSGAQKIDFKKWAEVLDHPRYHRQKQGAATEHQQKQQPHAEDFGKKSCHGECCPLTDIVSTRKYRAPELLVGCAFYDGGVDVFGLGCIFFELVTAGHAFLFFGAASCSLANNNNTGSIYSYLNDEEASDHSRLVNQLKVLMERLLVVPSEELLRWYDLHHSVSSTVREAVTEAKRKFADRGKKFVECGPKDFIKYDWNRIAAEVKVPEPVTGLLRSQECQDALNGMLQFSPLMRVTATQILNMPIFASTVAATRASYCDRGDSSSSVANSSSLSPKPTSLRDTITAVFENVSAERIVAMEALLGGCRSMEFALEALGIVARRIR